MSSKPDYQCLASDDDDGRDDALTTERILNHNRYKKSQRFFVGAIAALVACTIIIITDVALHLWVFKASPSMLDCAKMTSPYSPIWDAVEFYEGDFVNYFNHSTIYRGPPTLEREEAWDKLWNHWAVAVDDAGIAALNKTGAADYIRINGSDPNHPTYGAGIEVFHQLHCLNKIRQYTWPMDYFDPAWDGLYPGPKGDQHDPLDAVTMRMHVDHCIETLRLSIMCYADITPRLTFLDLSKAEPIRSDFNVHHVCRNFDKIVEYVDATKLDIEDVPTKEQHAADGHAADGHAADGHSRKLHV